MSNIDLQYIGSNQASNEGLRHFFMLKCINNSYYINLTGSETYYFPVYTSTGANTGVLCSNNLCVIPCFGIATLYLNNNIIAPILKTDYIHFFNTSPNYERIKDLANFESIDLNNMAEFYNTQNIEALNVIRKKIGCKFFYDNIKVYTPLILDFIYKKCFKLYPNLLFVNTSIGVNNFIGISLDNIIKYKDYIKVIPGTVTNFRPDILIGDTSNTELLNNINTNIYNILKIVEKNESDKFTNILNSPLLTYIKYIINTTTFEFDNMPDFRYQEGSYTLD